MAETKHIHVDGEKEIHGKRKEKKMLNIDSGNSHSVGFVNRFANDFIVKLSASISSCVFSCFDGDF